MNEKEKLIFISVIISLIFFIVVNQFCIFATNEKSYFDDGLKDKKVIGATYMTMNNSYFKIINEEIRNRVEEEGDVLITRDPALNLQKQIDEIYEFIDLKVDAIFINPIDWIGIKSALKDAKAAGIIIIAIDTDVYEDDVVDCTIVSDNYEAGVQCADELIKSKNGGNVLLLEHSTAKSAIDRIKGFENTISKNSNFKVIARSNCNGQLEIAMPVTEKLLKEANNNIDVIMALNDPSALGAIMALDNMKLKNISVYGIDGSPDGKKMVKEGKMAATISQSPRKIGRMSYQSLYDIFNKKPIDKKIVVPVKLINKSNVDNYKIDAWD